MNRLSQLFLVLAAVGIPDAMYHGYEEITSYSAPLTGCYINSFVTCVGVFRSGYTKFLGISLWVYGVFWFPLILVLGLWSVRRFGALEGGVMIPVLMVGDAFTLYLWYLELDVIHALCPVCVSMYFLNYAMTAVATIEWDS